MIIGTGIDLLELARIEQLLLRHGERFQQRVFSPAERAYCLSHARPGPSFAARFAAKEAVMKCLGTGWSEGIGFGQIEVLREASGAVGVRLSGAAATRAQHLGIERFHLSLSHTEHHAIALAVAEGTENPATGG